MIQLNVDDMTCGRCVDAVTRAIKTVDPQAHVQVDLDGKQVTVQGARSAGELIRALGHAGYPAIQATGAALAPAARSGCCCAKL